MRPWTMGKIIAGFLIFGICLVVAWLFLNFRSTRLADLQGQPGAVAKNGKVLPEKQEGLPKVIKNDDAPVVIPIAAPQPRRVDGGIIPKVDGDTPHLAKARFQLAKTHGLVINDLLNKAEKELAAWENHQKTLFNEDAGRRIAASKDHIQQVATLLENGRPSEGYVKGWRDQLKTMLAPIEMAERDEKSAFLPGEAFVKDLEKLAMAVKDFLRAYEQDRLTLEAILADSRGIKETEKGLKQAIAEMKGEYARNRALAIAEATKTAFDESTKKLAAAAADAARLVGEEEAKLVAVKAAAEKARLQGVIEAEKRKAEKERLVQRAKDPTIQGKYQAFLKPGYVQFTEGPESSLLFQKSERPESVRFGNLSALGWLKDSKSFARAVSKQPNPFYGVTNDRPAYPYPRNADEWKQMDRMLEEFLELGPVWVEMGLLRP